MLAFYDSLVIYIYIYFCDLYKFLDNENVDFFFGNCFFFPKNGLCQEMNIVSHSSVRFP